MPALTGPPVTRPSVTVLLAAAAHAVATVPWQAVGRRHGLPYRAPAPGALATTAVVAVGAAAVLDAAVRRAVTGQGSHEARGADAPLGWAALGWFPVLGPVVTTLAEWRCARRLSGTGHGPGQAARVVATLLAITGARIATGRLITAALAPATPPPLPPPRPMTQLNTRAQVPPGDEDGFVVYFDGVGRIVARTTPVGRAFAAALALRLPRWTIVMSLMPNDVTQRPAWQRPLTAAIWRAGMRADPALLIARGVWEAIVFLDPRYRRHLARDHTAAVLRHVRAAGYRPGSGTPLVMVGLSAGAQTALTTASDVARALGAPVDVVSFGGFFDGAGDLSAVRRVHAAISWADPAELAPVPFFPARWTALGTGSWSRAIRSRQVVRHRHDFATHVGHTGYLGQATTPDGRTRQDQAADLVARAAHELAGHVHRGERPAQSRVRP